MKKGEKRTKRLPTLGSITVAAGILAFIGLVLSGCGMAIPDETGNPNLVTVYKQFGCVCCSRHADYLESEGYQVDVHIISEEEQDSLRKKYPLPEDMQSCHISVYEGYFVEGHMPVEAMERLREERPDIDGIFLPGMPAGSPGMAGEPTEPFIIYAFSDGEITEYMTIGE